jgi:hypothetical protein
MAPVRFASVKQQRETSDMTITASLLGRLSGGVSIALLALGMTVGAPQGARADEAEALAPSPQDMIVAPIVKAVDALTQRMSQLEESVALFAASFNAQRMATRQLCIADETGAETCISKAQLDGLLKRVAQADVSEPAVIVAIAAPAAESTAADVAAAAASLPDVPVADAIVTEALSSPLADAIESVPATEVVASVSEAAANEPQYTGSTSTDGAALVWYPEVEVTIAGIEETEGGGE